MDANHVQVANVSAFKNDTAFKPIFLDGGEGFKNSIPTVPALLLLLYANLTAAHCN
jgi:hypothetical protein